ncbi:unnamed protein product [marine sediment metagenome]|uniref:Uncharacterized protein n=1 Tax=marine sediment metagenome TaxID=412755 RepID=X1UW23_9ZZZZ
MVSSVPVAAILSVYLGNQLSAISILPTLLIDFIDPFIYSLLLGSIVPTIILALSITIFARKQF